MTRSILLTLAAVVALATTPSLAASAHSTTTENWEQAARAYAAYAFGNPQTSSAAVDALETGSIPTIGLSVPYTGFGDPLGLTSPVGIDAVETGSIATMGAYVPYTGFGDPAGLTAPVDRIETGTVVEQEAWQVNVQEFCEGEGRELARRLYLGFCHFTYEP